MDNYSACTAIDLVPLIAEYQRLRSNTWIETFTGKIIDFRNFRQEDVSIEDIAHALSKKCRFGGHCREFYSVAEHSVLVSYLIERLTDDIDIIRAGFSHDSPECYMEDLTTPLKNMCPGFKMIEERIAKVIGVAFGIKTSFSDELIRMADFEMFAKEKEALMSPWGEDTPWGSRPEWNGPNIDDVKVLGLSQKNAKTLFLERADELGIKLHV